MPGVQRDRRAAGLCPAAVNRPHANDVAGQRPIGRCEQRTGPPYSGEPAEPGVLTHIVGVGMAGCDLSHAAVELVEFCL